MPHDLFAVAPHDKRAAVGLDVLKKNPYADVHVSGRAAALPVYAAKASGAEKFGLKGENTVVALGVKSVNDKK